MIEVKPKGDGFVHNVFPQRNKSICTIQVYNNKIIQIIPWPVKGVLMLTLREACI